MKQMFLLLLLCISHRVHAQIANADFEDWYTDTSGQVRLQSWEHMDGGDDPIPYTPFYGTWQESSSQHGAKALKMSRWYNYTWDAVRQKAPVNYRPAALTGYYKYTDNNLINGTVRSKDTALLDVYLTSWNAALQRRDTIGRGTEQFTASSQFMPFSCPLVYASAGVPDSLVLRFMPTKFKAGSGSGICADSGLCSFLTIDNLSLVQSTAIAGERGKQPRVFPNPATDVLIVDLGGMGTSAITITDAVGKRVSAIPVAASGRVQLNIYALSEGFYFLHIAGEQGVSTVPFIKRNNVFY